MIKITNKITLIIICIVLTCFGQIIKAQTFVHITDLHVAHNNLTEYCDLEGYNFQKMCDAIRAMNPAPAFVLAGGDIVNTSMSSMFGVIDFENWEAVTNKLYKNGTNYYLKPDYTIPIYFVPGNHDYRWYGHAGFPNISGYRQYMPTPTLPPSGFTALVKGTGDVANNYYFYNNDMVVICLESGYDNFMSTLFGNNFLPESTGLSTPQITFLTTILQAHSNKQKIILMHAPAVNPNGENNYGRDYLGRKLKNGEFESSADGCIRFNVTNFINLCTTYHYPTSQVVVLQGHAHQNVVLNSAGILQTENWTEGPRFVQTANASKGALRVVNVTSNTVDVQAPTVAFNFVEYGKNSCVEITPEMLHHSSPNKGAKSFHLVFCNADPARFMFSGFAPGTQLKISATEIGSSHTVTLKVGNVTNTSVIAQVNYTVGSSLFPFVYLFPYTFITVKPTCGLVEQGIIKIEDVTWNNNNKSEKDEYIWNGTEYIEKKEIIYEKEPENITKSPLINELDDISQKSDSTNSNSPKSNIVPFGEVVMCKDASWFCNSSCMMYAVEDVTHFEKGWTFTYGNNYWVGDGGGAPNVIATFIYNSGYCGNTTFVFYRPDGTEYYRNTKDFYCGDPGYWGYQVGGIYIYNADWFPEGTWTVQIFNGNILKKTIPFDVTKSATSYAYSFISPTPAEGSVISGINNQYEMTAASNAGFVPGADYVNFWVDGKLKEAIPANNDITKSVWDIRDLSEGAHTVRAELKTSYFGWLSTGTRTVYIDNTPPAYCNITSPVNNAVISGNFTATVSVPGDVAKVDYYIDGVPAGYSTSAPFSTTLSSVNDDLTINLQAVAYDLAGNICNGSTVTFTIAAIPTLTTTSVSSITQTTATSGGNVTAAGSSSVTARGVCWSTSANPTTANSKTSNGTGTGSFTSSITGLTAGTTYYVRAYATSSAGTGYGQQVTFSTTTSGTLPTITTTSVISITQTTATSGGNVTAAGSSSVTARGVCWSTSANPTIANSKTSNGTGTGSFTSSITGLTAGTTYYVRAYATNSVGTAYGSQISFSTISGSGSSTSTFESDLDGWTYWGGSGYSLTRSADGYSGYCALISGEADSGHYGMQKNFTIGSSFNVSFWWRAVSGYSSSTVTNARIKVTSLDESSTYYTYYLQNGTVYDSGWKQFSKDLTSYVSGKTQVKVILYLGDGWAADWQQKNYYDNISIGTSVKSFDAKETIESNISCYPNPFSSNLNISYTVTEDCAVTIDIYDFTGKNVSKVIDENQVVGRYHVVWNSDESLTTGIYFCKIVVNGNSTVSKIILLK